jgi:hypothetical protein
MSPNVVVFTSTRTQEFYDVNFAWVHTAMDMLRPAADPIGSLFANRAMRCFKYAGQASILAVLYLLWPGLEDKSIAWWQEWYMYQNSYTRDDPESATMHTRHSFSPHQWFQAIVSPMALGPRFYATFWDFTIAPLYDVVSRSLNYMAYRPYSVEHFVGVQEWLWPCLGELDKETLSVLLGMIQRSWRSRYAAYKVPMRFLDILRSLTRHWQPRIQL